MLKNFCILFWTKSYWATAICSQFRCLDILLYSLWYFFQFWCWSNHLFGHCLILHWTFVESWGPSSHHSLCSHCKTCRVVWRDDISSCLVELHDCEFYVFGQMKSSGHFCCSRSLVHVLRRPDTRILLYNCLSNNMCEWK